MKTAKIITIIFVLIFLSCLLLTIFGCSTEPEPIKELDLTGIYQSVDYEGEFHNGYDIKLFLVHSGKSITGIGEFNGSGFEFSGVIKGNEVMLSFILIYQGYIYQCKMDLFYSEDYYPLSGGATIINGTKAVQFDKIGILKKHNQGGLYESY